VLKHLQITRQTIRGHAEFDSPVVLDLDPTAASDGETGKSLLVLYFTASDTIGNDVTPQTRAGAELLMPLLAQPVETSTLLQK
jgi:hypothetical protein